MSRASFSLLLPCFRAFQHVLSVCISYLYTYIMRWQTNYLSKSLPWPFYSLLLSFTKAFSCAFHHVLCSVPFDLSFWLGSLLSFQRIQRKYLSNLLLCSLTKFIEFHCFLYFNDIFFVLWFPIDIRNFFIIYFPSFCSYCFDITVFWFDF